MIVNQMVVHHHLRLHRRPLHRHRKFYFLEG
jgi:hypothetical protein